MTIGKLVVYAAIGGAIIIELLRAMAVTVAQFIQEERAARRQAAVDARRQAAIEHARYRARFEDSMGEITRLQMEGDR